jgi:hypothetical protein
VHGPAAEQRWSFLCKAVYGVRNEPTNTQGNTVTAILDATWQWVQEYHLLRARDCAGRTILHMAMFYGSVDVVKVLVERGASVYDCLGEPMSVSWGKWDISGLGSLSFARVLLWLSVHERWALYFPDLAERPDEGMRAIVRFLEEFQWPEKVPNEDSRCSKEIGKRIGSRTNSTNSKKWQLLAQMILPMVDSELNRLAWMEERNNVLQLSAESSEDTAA